MRERVLIAGVCIVVALAAYGVFGPRRVSEARPAAASEPAAPALTVNTPAGPKSLADYHGKVVLVDFWATWCPPCRAAIPHIEALYNKYQGQGLEVVGASVDDTDGVVARFVKQAGMTYTVGRLADMSVQEKYGVQGYPTMVLLDRKGAIRWRQEGFDEGGEKDIEQQVVTLLKEQEGRSLAQ